MLDDFDKEQISSYLIELAYRKANENYKMCIIKGYGIKGYEKINDELWKLFVSYFELSKKEKDEKLEEIMRMVRQEVHRSDIIAILYRCQLLID